MNNFNEKIKAIFDPWQKSQCPGGQVYVKHAGQIIFDKCFGYADIEHDALVNENTIFHVASVSKQITCMCILILHEHGKLDINKDIRAYISDLVLFKEAVTINDMMCNISGIRDQWSLQVISGVRLSDHITQSDLLALSGRQRSLGFKPRSNFGYSNTNFLFLSEIVKRVSGMNLNAFATKNIFKPLAMTDTFFRERYDQIIPNRAMSYKDCGDGDFLWKSLNYSNEGPTSLHTTATDFLKWLQNFRKPTICKPETLEMMLKIPELTDPEAITNYACGVAVDKLGDSYRHISHGGVDAAYNSFAMTFPDDELDIVIFSNTDNVNLQNAAFKIARMILGIEEDVATDNKLYCDETGNLQDFIGEYLINKDTLADIIEKDGHFFLEMNEKKSSIKHLDGNGYDLLDTPYELYIVSDEIFISVSPDMSFKLEKLVQASFSDKEMLDISGFYFNEELETFYEIIDEDGKLYMRHKRYGKAVILDITEEDAKKRYYSLIEHPMKFNFVRTADERISGLTISDGRAGDMLFQKVNFVFVE